MALFDRANKFCERFGLRIPILQAPMAAACPPSLAIAVANAGGMGGCGALTLTPEQIRQWADEVRASDLLARYGGDEFALLLPDCTIERAMEIIERLEVVCQSVSFSTGVANWGGVEDAEALLRRADDALYLAKSQGGGRSILASSIA